MIKQRTYHIYLNDRCLFKNLDADEFDVVWGRLYHSYWDGLTYSEMIEEEIKDPVLSEDSY
tara:strand:+ start:288 stop:470 length:183 start_codon:yes stop_codon:yes gene_type:complete